jgi:hypothetical protein
VRTSSVLVAKAKRSMLLVLHVPSVSVALAPRSPVALTAHAVKIVMRVAVVMVIVRASQTVPAVKIAAKEAVVMVIVRVSLTARVAKIAVKVAVPRKKMKGDCGLMIASATAMKRDVNVLGISALSISRPSLEVAMSSH